MRARKTTIVSMLCVCLAGAAFEALAVDAARITEIKRTAADAHIPYVEHADDAPWDDRNGRYKLDVNSDFGLELARRMAAQGLGTDDTIIVMRRSGDRSARATNLLKELGYGRVYSVVDGFEGDLAKDGPQPGKRVLNGWKNVGLPWSYKLDKSKLYFPKY